MADIDYLSKSSMQHVGQNLYLRSLQNNNRKILQIISFMYCSYLQIEGVIRSQLFQLKIS